MQAFYPAGAPQLPGFAGVKSYASHPVWKDSAREEIKFAPLAKKDAVKIWHHARRFENQTRDSRGQGAARVQNGNLSRVGLAVLQSLLFDFLNYKTGRLDPCYSSIAAKAGVSLSSVYRSLVRLRDAGILSWVRRCSASYDGGVYVLEQESNAYGLSPATQWRGYRAPPEAPPPDPGAWGAAPAMAPLALQAVERHRAGDARGRDFLLDADPGDWIARAAAALRPRSL